MKLQQFRIRNFKGIENCKINLENEQNPIITLVGLNESGKTTILEAIANFIGEDLDLLSVIGSHRPKSEVKDFIPKHKKANFSDRIEFEGTLVLSEDDKDALSDFFQSEHHLTLNKGALPEKFTINKTHKFQDSEPISSTNYWSITFSCRAKGQKKDRSVTATVQKEIWLAAIKIITDRLPRICYFPTFLFEVPERIYFENAPPSDSASHYYKRILQDVLDAQGEGLSLQTHVVDRVAKHRSVSDDSSVALKNSFNAHVRSNLDHLFRKMSTELNRVIFGAWNEIFEKRPKNKRIEIKWYLDEARGYAVYCQINILDGEESYALSERSLGFRWFFCFLLFTQFGAFRGENRKTFFLLDEPASNLHSSAQAKLLASLPRMTGDRNVVIYSTHSHYMIEPLWLEQAYIVVNKAVDYDQGDVTSDYFSGQPTNINAEKYRTFVGSHPNQTTYFQPVLDCLDYRASPLIGSKKCLIVEGKHDYYAFKYFLPAFGCDDIDIMPGAGAGNMNTLISLFIGWGRDFLILLDDDKAGREQKQRYIDEYLLPDERIATLGDVDKKLEGNELEDLFGKPIADVVKAHFSLSSAPQKKNYALYFQELAAKGAHLDVSTLDEDTKSNMNAIGSFVQLKFL